MKTYHEVTKAELKALKSADTICFDFIDGQSQIRAIQHSKNSSDGFEQTIIIPCNSRLRCHDGYNHETYKTERQYKIVRGYVHETNGPFANELATIWRILKAGNVITLHWRASGGNGYTGKARGEFGQRLHHDQLGLEIKHETPRGKVVLSSFNVRDSICPNNSARMIKTQEVYS